jgi:hypothetical protein
MPGSPAQWQLRHMALEEGVGEGEGEGPGPEQPPASRRTSGESGSSVMQRAVAQQHTHSTQQQQLLRQRSAQRSFLMVCVMACSTLLL